MIFIVPDDDTDFDFDDIDPDDDQTEGEPQKDSSEADIPKSSQKVELDLDDAPFLEDLQQPEEEEEEKPPEEPEEEQAFAPEEEAEGPPSSAVPWWKNKWVLIGLASSLALSLLVIVFLLLPDEPSPTTPGQISKPDRVQDKENLITMEPFLIEQQSNGSIRFLECQFALPAQDPRLQEEIRKKNIVLRDAIYYYLRNKEPTFLADKNKVETLKADLLSVVNQYLGSGKLENILVEKYVVR